MLGRHDGADGAAFRRAWAALTAEFGMPARASLLALEMGRAALLYVTMMAAQRRLADARRQRDGKGRRPSQAQVLRLEKRAALADSSWSAALDRLRDLAGRRPAPTIADLVQRNGG
jgi:hypothetical protein